MSYENKKIIELAEIVAKNVQDFFDIPKIEIEVKKDTVDNRSYHVNSDKIKKELGWEPDTPFMYGIRETIDWYIKKIG